MGWSEEDWNNKPLDFLIRQFNGYRADRKELWEMHRMGAFYSFIAMQGNKTIKKPSDLFKIPGEKMEPVKIATARKMTEDEIRERYGRVGFTDERIEKIIDASK